MSGTNSDIYALHQRTSPRIVIDKPVQWNGHSATTRDISGGGLFVRTTEPPPVGAELALRLALRDEGPPLTVAATVLRNQGAPDSGAAVQFRDDQPEARAEIAAFLLELLAQDDLHDTTEIVPLLEPRLVEWQQALERKQDQLDQAVKAMARVRDNLRATKKRNDARAADLDRREEMLRAAGDRIERERHDLEREWHERQGELDLRRAKLVELAQALKEERQLLGDREDGLDDRALELEETARQLDETKRQLQVHAFERNLLAQQLQQARSERESLLKRTEQLEQRLLERAEGTQRVVMSQVDTPVDGRSAAGDETRLATDDVPTAVQSLNPRARWMRLQASMRSAGAWLRDLFNGPAE